MSVTSSLLHSTSSPFVPGRDNGCLSSVTLSSLTYPLTRYIPSHLTHPHILTPSHPPLLTHTLTHTIGLNDSGQIFCQPITERTSSLGRVVNDHQRDFPLTLPRTYSYIVCVLYANLHTLRVDVRGQSPSVVELSPPVRPEIRCQIL